MSCGIAKRTGTGSPRYTLHEKLAYKGEQQQTLNAMLADMADGVISVLVVWHSDRLERRGTRRGYALLEAVEAAGGRIEWVKDPEFGGESAPTRY